MAFVHDSETAARAAKFDPIKKHEAQIAEMLAQEERNCIYVEDGEFLPDSFDHQLGQPLTHEAFEKKLAKILPPNLVFVDHPYNNTKRLIMRQLPTGEREYVAAYERGTMTEHSVMKVKTIEMRDFAQRHISRSDLPKFEMVPGLGLVWDQGTTRPGWKKVKKLWGEERRGWRTVLLRLIQQRLVSVDAIEKVFGSDNRSTWAAQTGKQNIALPW